MNDRQIYIKCKELGLDVSIHHHNLQIIGKLLSDIETLQTEIKDVLEFPVQFHNAIIEGRIKFQRIKDVSNIRIVTGTCYVGTPTLIYYQADDKWALDVSRAYIVTGDVEHVSLPKTNRYHLGYAFLG